MGRSALAIGQVFHLTPLVFDLHEATELYERLFAPHVYYRGYERHLNNRAAALMAVSEFVIEPIEPRPPAPGQQPTTIRRYLERFGPGIHSLAVYVDDKEEIRERLVSRGLRAPDGGMPTTVFTHPKDFPGLIEFFDPNVLGDAPNPRRAPGWSSEYWRSVHPLGIEFASHVTLLVRDAEAAAKVYADVLDSEVLPDQEPRAEATRSCYVTLGTDCMVELAEPAPGSAAARALDRVGDACWWGLTFKVRDIAAAREWLRHDEVDAPILEDGDDTIRLDPGRCFGVELAVTERALEGDGRAAAG